MGYGKYNLEDGKGDRGYSQLTTCEAPECTASIDRGLSYLCYSCTGYFCESHLTQAWNYADEPVEFTCFAGTVPQCCSKCAMETP